MGVKNLWKLLSSCGKRVPLQHKTLAIDTSIWIYQYRNLPINIVVFSFCKRLFRILYTQIKPVFVFDGTPPMIKQKRLEERRKANEKNLLKRYLANEKCSSCGEVLRKCKHFTQENLEALNNEVFKRIKNHKYNWGELSEDEELEEYFKKGVQKLNLQQLTNDPLQPNTNDICNVKITTIPNSVSHKSDIACNDKTKHISTTYKKKAISATLHQIKKTTCKYVDNSISNFDKTTMENLSKTKQLAMLIDLRQKRKLPMQCDTSSSLNFSNNQIENLKKRNNITTLIKNLNKDANKTVQSDCSIISVLTKPNEDTIYKNFCCIEDKVPESEPPLEPCVDGLEYLFEWHNNDIWNKEDKKYVKPKENLFKVEERITLNKQIINDIELRKDINNYLLPKIQPQEVSTAEHLSKEVNQPNISSEEESDSCNFDLLDDYLKDLSDDSFVEVRESAYESTKTKDAVSLLDLTEIKEIKSLIIEILKIFEIPFLESLGESDPQCWELYKKGLIDGVISEDSDMIIYGTTVYKNFFRKDKDILEFSLEEVKDQMNLTQDDLIKLGYLLGSDYCSGQKGVGIKRAIDKIETVGEYDVKFLYKIYKEDENVIKVNELLWGSLNRYKFRKFLTNKGVELAKIEELLLYMEKVQEVQTLS